jgi:hypothetical protein
MTRCPALLTPEVMGKSVILLFMASYDSKGDDFPSMRYGFASVEHWETSLTPVPILSDVIIF